MSDFKHEGRCGHAAGTTNEQKWFPRRKGKKMSDLPELKPCPFCNPKKIRDFRYVVQVTQGDKYGVACINHTCKASPVVLADTQEAAYEIWNTRADLHEALKAENEELSFVLQQIKSALINVIDDRPQRAGKFSFRGTLQGKVQKLIEDNKKLREAALNIYENRLYHDVQSKNWEAPRRYFIALGEVLSETISKCGSE